MIDKCFYCIYGIRLQVRKFKEVEFFKKRSYAMFQFILVVLILSSGSLFVKTNTLNIEYIGACSGCLFILSDYFEILHDAIDSARKLLKALIMNFSISFIIVSAIAFFNKGFKWLYILLSIVIANLVLWFVICLLVNLKASKLINEVFSLILTLITGLINIIFLFIPDSFNFYINTVQAAYLRQLGYTPLQVLQIIVNVILFYFIFMNVITLVAIDTYLYWEDKYIKDTP